MKSFVLLDTASRSSESLHFIVSLSSVCNDFNLINEETTSKITDGSKMLRTNDAGDLLAKETPCFVQGEHGLQLT